MLDIAGLLLNQKSAIDRYVEEKHEKTHKIMQNSKLTMKTNKSIVIHANVQQLNMLRYL
jgi:hypothetical protein